MSTSRQAGTVGSASKTYDCEICKDETGYVVVNPERGGACWRECECVERKKMQRLMRSSQMSDELRRLGFKNFDPEGRPRCVQQAFACAKDYYKRFADLRHGRQNSIALLGVPGTGKTHLLVAVGNCLMPDGVGVMYFPHVEGFDDIRDNLDDKEAKIHAMKTVDVLLWDDLFKGRAEPTEWQKETIFGVINYRYLHNKPIMISSERSIDQICDIDLGIGSRIYEMTKNHTVLLLPDKEAGVKELNYRLRGA